MARPVFEPTLAQAELDLLHSTSQDFQSRMIYTILIYNISLSSILVCCITFRSLYSTIIGRTARRFRHQKTHCKTNCT